MKNSIKDKGRRDISTYEFNGNNYNKSRLALAIIKFYCKENKPTYRQLTTVFPMKLIKPYGLIRRKEQAMEMCKDRDRFFIKDHEIIELSDGPIAVSNQFTKDRIDLLIQIASEQLKYKIS